MSRSPDPARCTCCGSSDVRLRWVEKLPGEITSTDMGMWHARLLGERHWLVMLMHFQYFTRRSLERLLDRAGFSRVSLATAPPYRVEIPARTRGRRLLHGLMISLGIVGQYLGVKRRPRYLVSGRANIDP